MKMKSWLLFLCLIVCCNVSFLDAIADSEIYVRTGPLVTSFEIDMNFGGITLHFDQLVLARTLDSRQVALQSHDHSGTVGASSFQFLYHTPSDLWSLGNTSTVVYFMHRDDFARLVTLSPQFVTSAGDTFLTMAAGAVLSSLGLASEPISADASLPVSIFTADVKSPYMRSFGLDMDRGLLSVEFTEPMDEQGFTLRGLALQDRANGLRTEKYVQLEATPWSCNQTLDYGRVFVCDLGRPNLDAVKSVDRLCTANTTCFLSAHQPFGSDMAGNEVVIEGFDRIFGTMTSNYTADCTAPVLEYWALDLNLGTLTLFFSESIFMPLFNYSGIVVCNRATLGSSTTVMRVHRPIISSYKNTPKVTVQLNDDQFNFVKLSEDLATGDGSSDTFLVLEAGLARDTSAQQNLYLGTAAMNTAGSMALSNMTQDLHSPELDTFSVDLTAETLTLRWNEVVSVASVDMTEFRIQSSKHIQVGSETAAIPGTGDLITAQNSKVLVFSLGSIFSRIKAGAALCRSAESCFAAFTYRFLEDQAGNAVVQVPSSRARRAVLFTPDQNAPYLVSWTVNLDTNQLVLSFSEPVDVESFLVQGVVLSNRAGASIGADTVALTPSSNSSTRVLDDLYIDLSYQDANAVKSSTTICAQISQCFLSFTDVAGQPVGYDVTTFNMSGVPVRNALQYSPLVGTSPSSFVADVTRPVLLAFSVDLDQGLLLLTFSEPVQTAAGALNATGIALYNNDTDAALPFLRLSSESFSEDVDAAASNIKLVLARQDFYALKREALFGSSAGETTLWLSVANFTFLDRAGNFVDERVIGTPASLRRLSLQPGSPSLLAPQRYFADKAGAAIVGMRTSTTGASTNVTVFFNDALQVDSVAAAALYVASFEAIRSVSLGGAALSSASAVASELVFSTAPITSSISATVTVLSSQYHSYVYLSGTAVARDSRGNWNQAMQKSAAVRAGGALIYFRLDMTARVLYLETVFPLTTSLASISAPLMRLVNVDSNDKFALTSFSAMEASSDRRFLRLSLTAADVAALQARQLVTSRAALRLEVDAGAVLDSSSSQQLNASTSLRCAQLVSDLSAPTLARVDLHLGTGLLTLVFSEHIVVSSVDVLKLSLTDAAVNGAVTVSLIHATLSSATLKLTTTDTIVIDLNSGSTAPTDRDRIHLSGSVGRSLAETYLVVGAGCVHDTRPDRPNYLEPVLPASARPAESLVPDLVAPKLLHYEVDFTQRAITFHFNEAVSPSSLKPSQLIFLPSPATPSSGLFSLSARSSVSAATLAKSATTSVTVLLNSSDVDDIMLRFPALMTSATNTYLAFPSGVIKDIGYSSNSIEQIFKIYARSPVKFVPDRVPPVLLWFDLSVHSRRMHLLFDEEMDCFGADVSKVSFQYRLFTGTIDKFYTLSPNSSSVLDCRVDNHISREVWLQLGWRDIQNIKLIPSLMKSADSTHLRLARGAFTDAVGNEVEPLLDAHALLVRSYEGDVTRPRLTGFTVTLQGLMLLKFSEPVLLSSFQLSSIKFRRSRDANAKTLSLATPPSSLVQVNVNHDKLILYILPQFQHLLDTTDMFTRQDTVYITFPSSLVSDTFYNAVEGNTDETAMNMGPGLDGWDLDLDAQQLRLYFSEPMQEHFAISGVVLQDAAGTPSTQVQLTGTPQGLTSFDNMPFNEPGTAFSAQLSSGDVTLLKLSPLLSGGGQGLYLWAPLGLARSSATNTALPHMNSTETIIAVPIHDFFPDVTGPTITQVVLDLDAGQLKISFDEPVVGASLDPRKLSLLSDAYGNSISLTALAAPLLTNASVLVLNLTAMDLNAVKYSFAFGSLDKMLCQVDFITDLSGNVLLGDAALHYQKFVVDIDLFVLDTTPPRLLSFSIDLSSDTLDLVFDELVEHWSIRPWQIQLLSASNSSNPSTQFLQLSNYSVVLGDANSRQSNVTVDLGLLRADAFRLQAEALIGRNVTTTFLHLSGVTDIAGNERLGNTSVVRVSEIKSDESAPELEGFDFALGSSTAQVTLYFSEVLDITSFDCADFKFVNEQHESPGETVTLATSECAVSTVTNSRKVTYTVAASKFNSGEIGAAPALTFVAAPSPASTADRVGNLLRAVDTHFAKMAGPQVVGVLLDVSGDSNGTLHVIFSKDVARASFDGSKVGFHSLRTGEEFFLQGHVLTSGFLSASPASDFIVKVDLSPHNLIRLKNISISRGRVLLLLNSSCVVDDGGAQAAVATIRDHKAVSKFVPDTSRPVMLSLGIDMSANTILIEFNEPIATSGLHMNKLTLQSAAGLLSDPSVYSFHFSGGSFVSEFTDATVRYTLTMSSGDSGSIKLLAPHLATGLADTFLSVDYAAFADVSGNIFPTVKPANALQFTAFTEDTSAPTVLYFELNMESEVLTIVCSEPMRADTVDVGEIVLQSRYFGGPKYGERLQSRLSAANSRVISQNSSVIVIQLGADDVFNIRNTPNLVRKQISTYMILSADTATDLAGNKVTPIVDGEAYRAHSFLPDTTRPRVQRIVVDFSVNTIAFHFSETVWTRKADVRALRIQADEMNDLRLYHDFTSESNELVSAADEFSTHVSFKIGLHDLNAIKWRGPLGTSRDTAFFAWSGALVMDVFSNQVVGTSNLTAAMATSFVADTIPPQLLYYHLNMNTLVIDLEFSESLSLPLAHLEQGILQRTFVKRFGDHVNLSFSSATSGSDLQSNLLQIQIDQRTSHIMKYHAIAISQATSFLCFGSEFVADGFKNFISPVWDGSVLGHSPRTPELYVKDSTKPALVQWFVDYDQARLLLVFSEPVHLLVCGGLSFQFSSGFNFSVTDCSPQYEEYATTLVLRLLDGDAESCAASSALNSEQVCGASPLLSYSAHSAAEVARRLLAQTSGEDPAFLSIAAGALIDYAETPNYSGAVTSVAALGPDCSPCEGDSYLTVPCTTSAARVCGACTVCGSREWLVSECTAAQDTQCAACTDCPYGSFISQACSSHADSRCTACTRCVELEVETRECVLGQDATCDSCKRCSFEDAPATMAHACELTEKYHFWKNEHCCRTSFARDVPCDSLEVMETKYKLGLLTTN